MSEYPSTKPDLTDLHWADGGSHETITEPLEAKKDAGWAYKAQVPHDELNWLQNFIGLMAAWLDVAVPRTFTTLREGVAAATAPETFWWMSPATTQARGSLAVALDINDANDVIRVITNGYYVYTLSEDNVYVRNPDTFAVIGDAAPYAANNINDVACDGAYVYMVYTTIVGVGDEFEIWDAKLDAKTGGYNFGADCHRVVTNGLYAAVAASLSSVVCCLIDTGDVDSMNTYAFGYTIVDLAIDDDCAYAIGTNGTGYPVVDSCWLVDGTERWTRDGLPYDASKAALCVAADGDYVYVGTERGQVGAVDISLWCLNRVDGSTVWMVDTGADVTSIAVDDTELCVRSGTLECEIIDKRTGEQIDAITTTDIAGLEVYDSDGISWYGKRGGDSDVLVRYWKGATNKQYQKADPQDPNRRPFHKLAIPVR